MKALSIQQPWAWAIFNAGKDIENRDWNTQFRGPVLIHCGLKIDQSAFDDIEMICGRRPPKELPTGGIVGRVDIVGVSDRHDSKWFFGRYGFQLANATPLPFRPCKGALSFFTPDYSSVYAKDKPTLVPAQGSLQGIIK